MSCLIFSLHALYIYALYEMPHLPLSLRGEHCVQDAVGVLSDMLPDNNSSSNAV